MVICLIMTNWVYLSEIATPYAGGYYSMYKGADSFKMAGTDYYFGFTMNIDWNVHDLYFNLNGQFNSMTFDWGAVDGYEDADTSTVQVYEDDVLVDTLTRNKNDLPQSYSLNLKDVYKLRFVRSTDIAVGFGNVKLYY